MLLAPMRQTSWPESRALRTGVIRLRVLREREQVAEIARATILIVVLKPLDDVGGRPTAVVCCAATPAVSFRLWFFIAPARAADGLRTR